MAAHRRLLARLMSMVMDAWDEDFAVMAENWMK